MGKLEKCRIILRQFVVDSTFHGVSHTVLAPYKWMRILWIFLSATALGLGFAQIGLQMLKYLSKPTEIVTKVCTHFLSFFFSFNYYNQNLFLTLFDSYHNHLK